MCATSDFEEIFANIFEMSDGNIITTNKLKLLRYYVSYVLIIIKIFIFIFVNILKVSMYVILIDVKVGFSGLKFRS